MSREVRMMGIKNAIGQEMFDLFGDDAKGLASFKNDVEEATAGKLRHHATKEGCRIQDVRLQWTEQIVEVGEGDEATEEAVHMLMAEATVWKDEK